jgi:hypothetical protein
LGYLRTQFDPCDQILVPTLLEQIESRFENAVSILTQAQFGDLEIAAVQGDFKDIQDLLQRLDIVRRAGQDAVLASELKARLVQYRQEVLEDAVTSARYSVYSDTLGFLFEELKTFDPDNIVPGEYARLDQALYKIALLRDMVSAKALLAPSTAAPRLDAQERLTILDLQQTSWTSLQWARLHVREMQEGYFKDEVQAEIGGGLKDFRPIEDGTPRYTSLGRRLGHFVASQARLVRQKFGKKEGVLPRQGPAWLQSSRVALDTSSSEPRPFQGIQLKLRFAKESLNCAAARQEFVPVWDFGQGGLTPERGWEVTHYFPAQAIYTVKVAFKDRNGGLVVFPGSDTTVFAIREFSVGSSKDQASLLKAGAKLGIARLSLALIPVILALYSGASDQLAKLDVIPGMIAVFLLGFSSDQVKNLLTK